MAEGTTYEIDVDVQAGSAESAAVAVANLADRLTAAGAASTAAAEAVKAGELAYRQAEASADRAAKALEKVNVAAEAQKSKMAAAMAANDPAAFWRAAAGAEKLAQKQAEAATSANAAKLALNAEADSLDRLKSAASKAADEQAKMAKAHDATKKQAEALKNVQDAARPSGNLEGLTKGLKKLGGPIGPLADAAEDAGEGIASLAESIGVAATAATVAVVAIVALVAILVAGIATAGAWAVKMADAARTSRMLSDGIAGSVQAGGELDDTIKDLSKRVPQTRDELRGMAADLAKTGLKGKALSDALEENAEKAAALKWGPDFAKQTKSLGKLSEKFGNNLSDIFGRLDIARLLEGLSMLVDLFDANTVTGKATRDVFESLFQPLIDAVANFIPKAITAFIQLQIWLMKAMIAIKPFGSEILTVAKVLGVLVAVVAGLFVAALAVGIAIAVTFWTIIIKMGEAMKWVTEKVIGLGTSITDSLASISLADIGKNMIMGLVGGIGGAGPAVIDALTGVVSGAVNAAKSALGIASPSKVFAEIGMNTAEGMAGGVEGSTSSVQNALEAMVSPPSVEMASPSASTSASAASGGNTYQITIQAGGDKAKDILDAFTEWLESTGARSGLAAV